MCRVRFHVAHPFDHNIPRNHLSHYGRIAGGFGPPFQYNTYPGERRLASIERRGNRSICAAAPSISRDPRDRKNKSIFGIDLNGRSLAVAIGRVSVRCRGHVL